MKRALALLYVLLVPWWGSAAEASFQLERASPSVGAIPALPAAPSLPTPAVARPVRIVVRQAVAAPVRSEPGCGGTLPTCAVLACESGGNLTVRNREGSSASGRWQILRSTWANFGGYHEARDAPQSVQDAKARELWADSHGHWAACL